MHLIYVVNGRQAVHPVLNLEVQGGTGLQLHWARNLWVEVCSPSDCVGDRAGRVWPQTKQREQSLRRRQRHRYLKVSRVNEGSTACPRRAEVDGVWPQHRIALSCADMLEANNPLGPKVYDWNVGRAAGETLSLCPFCELHQEEKTN